MKRQQLLAWGLALSIAGSTVAGGTLSAAAQDLPEEAAIVQESSVSDPSQQEAAEAAIPSEVEGDKTSEINSEDSHDAKPEEQVNEGAEVTDDDKLTDQEIPDQETPDREEDSAVKNNMELKEEQTDKAVDEKEQAAENVDGIEAEDAGKTEVLQAAAAAEQAAVDKSALEEVIKVAEAELEHEARFTPDSFQIFEEALDAAKRVRDDASATTEQVQEAVDNLINAYQGLIFTVSGYSQYIQDLIDEAESDMVGELLYTPESWNAYQTAKRQMLALKENPNAYTQAEADAIIGQFVDAYNKLAMIPDVTDKSELKEAISLAESVVQNPSLYTPETVAAVQAVLDNIDTSEDAINALNSYQTDQLLNQLLNVLSSVELSLDGLKTQANVLKEVIDELSSTGAYNQTELENLQDRILAVEAVLNSPDITEDQAQQAAVDLNAIQTEIENLGMDAESMRGLLEALVNDAGYQELYDNIVAGNKEYTENSRNTYAGAYDRAKALLQSDDIADAEVYYDAFMELQLAMNTLVKTTDAGNTTLSDLATVIEQEKNTVGKPGGITQDYMDDLEKIREELENALSQAPVDNSLVEDLINKANATIMAANDNRVPAPEEPETPEQPEKPEQPESNNAEDKKPAPIEDTSVIQNSPTQKGAESPSQNPKTGDPASLAGLLALLGGSAGTILKVRKRREHEEQ